MKTRLDDVLHSHEGLVVSVLRGEETLYSTVDFQFPRDMVDLLQKARLGVASWHAKDREYRGLSESVAMPGSTEQSLQVRVAMDIAHHKHFLCNRPAKSSCRGESGYGWFETGVYVGGAQAGRQR